MLRSLTLSLLLVSSPAVAFDPFKAEAKLLQLEAERGKPAPPPVVIPAPDPKAVETELTVTPATELNLRCQGLLTALGQASKLRRDVTALADADKAMDLLQTALVNEVVAAAGEDYSVRDRLAKGAEAAAAMLPRAKRAAIRFVDLLRAPDEADAQTLANQRAVCSAVLARMTK